MGGASQFDTHLESSWRAKDTQVATVSFNITSIMCDSWLNISEKEDWLRNNVNKKSASGRRRMKTEKDDADEFVEVSWEDALLPNDENMVPETAGKPQKGYHPAKESPWANMKRGSGLATGSLLVRLYIFA